MVLNGKSLSGFFQALNLRFLSEYVDACCPGVTYLGTVCWKGFILFGVLMVFFNGGVAW